MLNITNRTGLQSPGKGNAYDLFFGSPVKVVNVLDGDTFLTSSGEYVRLSGVNTPERDAPGYSLAWLYLHNLIGQQTVTIFREATDKYGRTVASVWRGLTNVNEYMRGLGY
jgi:endonuclease YncB( thermonuclease family)